MNIAEKMKSNYRGIGISQKGKRSGEKERFKVGSRDFGYHIGNGNKC